MIISTWDDIDREEHSATAATSATAAAAFHTREK